MTREQRSGKENSGYIKSQIKHKSETTILGMCIALVKNSIRILRSSMVTLLKKDWKIGEGPSLATKLMLSLKSDTYQID